MSSQDDIDRLKRDLEAARKRRDLAVGKGGSGAENAYGQAYQQLVKAGAAPQLRYKYRCPKR
jgi:hypothetical protein